MSFMKINMGCGWRNFGSDWIHIDAGAYDHLDHNSIVDLPYENNTVDLIYASHVLEYFDRLEVNKVLSEWHRVLKPGSTLRLAVPNFHVMADLYLNKSVDLERFLGPMYGKMDMSSETIYHKTVYNFKSLKTVLEKNSFKDIKEYDWRNTDHSHHDDHSQAYIPHMDKENGTLISLNVECKK